ncbi:hypothetical protein [Halomonas stenophila]|uniref:Uncharacterized protein n=1 Tax=Halomonas stenophila TaxID=795312 RepID=A0A7W5HKW9_9GAMM|nr:hypothetical protein [Halomonas stenophila]MBB3230514.1 hypothetical protein [Halomonas stenophila]
MAPSAPAGRAASRPPLLRLLIVTTLLTLGVMLGYLVRHSLDGDDVQWTPPSTPCDLQAGPCRTELGEGVTLTLDLAGKGPIHALTVLPLEVQLAGAPAEAAVVTFVGRDMDMGLHRFSLAAAGGGVFRGDGQVALCSEAAMRWRARVVVDTPGGRLGSWFDFEVTRKAT